MKHYNLGGNKEGFVFLAHEGMVTPGHRYEAVRRAADRILKSDDPTHVAYVKDTLDSILNRKQLTEGVVQDNPFLSNFSLQYGNDTYIGELLAPEVPVDTLSGEYPVYDRRSRFAAPDASMSGRSSPARIQDSRTNKEYHCKPYALVNDLPLLIQLNERPPLNEFIDLTEATTEVMALTREIRIKDVLTSTANYATGNYATLSSSQRWNSSGGGDPLNDLLSGTAKLWKGRGPKLTMAACSLEVWNVLRAHPRILDLVKYTSPGLAQTSSIAEFFGWDGILVSEARNDTANEGQDASYDRIWGKDFIILNVAARPTRRNASFAVTFRFGSQISEVWFEQREGTRGAYQNRVSVHESTEIQAPDAGYLLKNVIA